MKINIYIYIYFFFFIIFEHPWESVYVKYFVVIDTLSGIWED